MAFKKQIIIVEDSEIIGQILHLTIENMGGYEPINFLTAETLLKTLETLQPKCFILDLHLNAHIKESMSGANLALKLKMLLPTIPIIMVTGSSDPEQLSELQGLPFAEIIHKDAHDVLDQLELAVEKYTL